MGRGWVLVVAAVVLDATPAVAAEVSFGVTGGFVLAGDQDVKVREFDATGALAVSRETRGVDASSGPIGGLTATVWGSYFGMQLDALYWETEVTVPRPGATATDSFQVEQSRAALFLSLLGRLPLGENGVPFVYLGLGGGLVRSRVRPGDTELGPGVGAVGGLAIPLTSRLRLRLEARYLVTPDVEAGGRAGIRVETSGSSRGNGGRFLFGPHLDTQFLPLLVGLDWVF